MAAALTGSGLRAQESIRSYPGIWEDLGDSCTFEWIGDLDGDGLGEFLVGAPNAAIGGVRTAGRAEVRSGATGAVLRAFVGTDTHQRTGAHLLAPGDVSGDGVPDYLVSRGPISFMMDGATHQSRTVFVVVHAATALGDLNGDGIDELLVSRAALVGGGEVEVHHGGAFDVRYRIESTEMSFGHAVARLGDVDQDGYDDFAVAAVGELLLGEVLGEVFVYSGHSGDFLYHVQGDVPRRLFGAMLCPLDDVSGDGVPDFMASSHSLAGSGSLFFLNGKTGDVLGRFDPDPYYRNGFWEVVAVGDVNGNGSNDVLAVPGERFGLSATVLYLVDGGTQEMIYTVYNPFRSFQGNGLPAPFAQFGLSVTGDEDGDDVPDFAALSLTKEGPDWGRVDLFSGAPLGLWPFGGSCPVGRTARAGFDEAGAIPLGSDPPGLPVHRTPRIGANHTARLGEVEVHLSRVAPGLRALLMIGTRRDLWEGLPLPLDLGFLGAPGCELLVDPAFLCRTTTRAIGPGRGAATLRLRLPNEPALVGTGLYAQWWIHNAPGSPTRAATTRGLEIGATTSFGVVR